MIQLNRNQIKYIAIIAMFMDHFAHGFILANGLLYLVFRFIGRLTCPIMCYFIAEGYRYTRNINKYTLRLGLFALISWIPFAYFKNGVMPIEWVDGRLNIDPTMGVIYTLFLGLIAIRVYEARDKYGFLLPMWKRAGMIFCLMYIAQVGDWSFYAVVMCLIFHIYHDYPKAKWICYTGIVGLFLVERYFNCLDTGVPKWSNIYVLGMLMVPVVMERIYNGEEGKKTAFTKWIFYVFYPLHLTILCIAKVGLIR